MEIKNFIENFADQFEDTDASVNMTVSQLMSTKTNGIEGLPYQFMESVDRRIPSNQK